uniref:Uncharacterized protein n=1 Tax=Arundo donax TaxID=35708 RepID=A0A0A9G9V6_ARUDO
MSTICIRSSSGTKHQFGDCTALSHLKSSTFAQLPVSSSSPESLKSSSIPSYFKACGANLTPLQSSMIGLLLTRK